MHVMRGAVRAGLLAGFAAAWCGSAQAAPCTPGELMAKVSTLTELLEHTMMAPLATRRAAVARMRAVMDRHQPTAVGYDGLCQAYDDLINQLRR